MSNLAGYAIDHIGAYLDDGSIDTVSKCGVTHTEYTPQVYGTSIISDSISWTKIQGSFIANGTERYITIGNFFDTAHTDKIPMNPIHYSYYEVDDVSVIASNAQADAGRDTTIYAGQTATIGVDSNGGGMPCYWYELGGSTAIDSGGTIEVHPTATTSYVVSMDLCGTVTYDTVTVNVTPCPAVMAAYTDTGSAVRGFTYTGTTALIDSVKWDFGDGHTDTALDPVHTYTANGTYHVCVTVYTICGSDSACSDVTVSGLGVASPRPSPKEREVMVRPNPTRGDLTLTLSINGEGVVCTMQGQVVATYKVHSGENNLQLPAGLSAGVYMLQITDAATGERVIKKVMKE